MFSYEFTQFVIDHATERDKGENGETASNTLANAS